MNEYNEFWKVIGEEENKTVYGIKKDGDNEGGGDEEGLNEYKWLSVWGSAFIGNHKNE